MNRETLQAKAEAIEHERQTINMLWQEYFLQDEKMDALVVTFEQEAQNNPSLTNSTKRKNYVTERKLDDEDYQEHKDSKADIKGEINMREAKIERLQNTIDIWTSESTALEP